LTQRPEDKMRIAVSQFATSSNCQKNLATCIRMIDEASECNPSLIVLPEYCNTQPYYVDHNQAWYEALSLNGNFLKAIAEQAKKYDCYILIKVTLRRNLFCNEINEEDKKRNITVTSCFYSPLGELIHQVNKQILTAQEKDFFVSENYCSEVVESSLGDMGFLIGSDDMSFEASRELSFNGAQLLCHSMSTHLLDQSNLHGAARACENNVFIVSANKIGSLIPEKTLKKINIQETLIGIGQSQIISPNGRVLAKMTHNQEGYTYADIDSAELSKCGINNKCRPDGTTFIKQLRPELYQSFVPQKETLSHLIPKLEALDDEVIGRHNNKLALTANIAIFATYTANQQAIDDVCHYIENNLSDIIQLPELFFITDKTITNNIEQRIEISTLGKQLIAQISSVLRPFQYVCTSLILNGAHQAVIINEQGLLATQQQLHFCQRYQWTSLGDEVNIIELPLEQGSINVAMLTADDANFAEIVKVTALNGIHLLLVPFDIQEPCEVEYSLLARAAENRICIAAASREKSFPQEPSYINGSNNPFGKNKIKHQKSTGFIANLVTDFTLLPQWKNRKFKGYLNQPIVEYQQGKITKAVIHPTSACDKSFSH